MFHKNIYFQGFDNPVTTDKEGLVNSSLSFENIIFENYKEFDNCHRGNKSSVTEWQRFIEDLCESY